MTYNASDRKDIRRAEKFAKSQHQLRLDFIRTSMASSSGRAWFFDLLSRCHLFHVLPPTNPLAREFEQGERNIGITIYTDILTSCPDLYLLMLSEAQQRELSNARSDPDAYADIPSPSELSGSPIPNGGTPLPLEPSDVDGWPSDLIGVYGDDGVD